MTYRDYMYVDSFNYLQLLLKQWTFNLNESQRPRQLTKTTHNVHDRARALMRRRNNVICNKGCFKNIVLYMYERTLMSYPT